MGPSLLGGQQPVITEQPGPGPRLPCKGRPGRKACGEGKRAVLLHRSENGLVVYEAHVLSIDFSPGQGDPVVVVLPPWRQCPTVVCRTIFNTCGEASGV